MTQGRLCHKGEFLSPTQTYYTENSSTSFEEALWLMLQPAPGVKTPALINHHARLQGCSPAGQVTDMLAFHFQCPSWRVSFHPATKSRHSDSERSLSWTEPLGLPHGLTGSDCCSSPSLSLHPSSLLNSPLPETVTNLFHLYAGLLYSNGVIKVSEICAYFVIASALSAIQRCHWVLQ